MRDIVNKICYFVQKESKTCIFVCMALLWVAIAYQSYSKNKLINQITLQQSELTALNDRLSNDKKQMNVLVSDSQSTYKTLKKLEEEVDSLTRRTDEVQQYQLDQALNQKRDDDTRPSVDDLNGLQTQLGSLQFQIKDLNQKLYELNKANITATVNNAQHPMTSSSNPSPSPTPKAVLKPLKPPFAVLGIESRGGELFVSVAPSKSTNLSQIKLLRTGDSYREWQLKTIRTNAAVFTVGTRQQVINVR